MRSLFDGRKDIFGLGKGRVERVESGKVFPESCWDSLFMSHLRGEANADLGIYLVRDDNTVTFCCVDIDEPNFELAREVAETMPTDYAWIEKSRSGNFHCWAFFDEPLEAWAARAVLRGVIVAVGQPALEIFPKQDFLREGMVGNYVSIPWHGEERPIIEGALGMAQVRSKWLEYADAHRTAADEWRRRARALGGKPRSAAGSEEFGARNSLHKCASYIFEHRADNQLVPGHRATVLFNVAKQCANCRHYDEAETVRFVEAINQAGTDPIQSREVERFVRNAFQGEFTSTGCDQMTAYASPDCGIANG
jgi:hypothetical protein